MGRQQDLDRLYPVLDSLAQRVGGPRKRKNCTDYMDWPDRGVYFSSNRGNVANRPTSHASRGWARTRSAGSGTTLWDRLKQHYGAGSASSDHPHGGTHRGSVYRKRVGEAIIEKYDLHDDDPTWDKRWSSARPRRGPRRGVHPRTPRERVHPRAALHLGRHRRRTWAPTATASLSGRMPSHYSATSSVNHSTPAKRGGSVTAAGAERFG